MTASPPTALSRAVDALSAVGSGQAPWSDAAQAACDLVGADEGACLVWRIPDRAVQMFDSYGGNPKKMQEYSDHFAGVDVLIDRGERTPAGHWVVSDEAFPEAQWNRHEFFGGFLHSYGVRQVLALVLHVEPGVLASFSFHRHSRMPTRAADLRRGIFRRFSRNAHLAFSARYSVAAAVRQSLKESLGDSARAWVFASGEGRLQAISPQASVPQLDCEWMRLDEDELWHADPASLRRIRATIRRAIGGSIEAICVPGGNGVILRIEARPAPRLAHVGDSHMALLSVERRIPGERPRAEDLRLLFDLTAAEARVLQEMCAGRSVQECAEALSCSVHTVRTHLAHILQKTCTRRQSELIQLATLAKA